MAQERSVLRRRHSEQLKAQVLAQCAEPGASVAKVAMSHALNANIVHGWVSVSARHLEQPGASANDRVHQEVRWTRWQRSELSCADGTVRS